MTDQANTNSGIVVENRAGVRIRVAINKWTGSRSTAYYPINDGRSSNWTRTDPRGFVMRLELRGQNTPYFVVSGARYIVEPNRVLEDGRPIEPVGVALPSDEMGEASEGEPGAA